MYILNTLICLPSAFPFPFFYINSVSPFLFPIAPHRRHLSRGIHPYMYRNYTYIHIIYVYTYTDIFTNYVSPFLFFQALHIGGISREDVIHTYIYIQHMYILNTLICLPSVLFPFFYIQSVSPFLSPRHSISAAFLMRTSSIYIYTYNICIYLYTYIYLLRFRFLFLDASHRRHFLRGIDSHLQRVGHRPVR